MGLCPSFVLKIRFNVSEVVMFNKVRTPTWWKRSELLVGRVSEMTRSAGPCCPWILNFRTSMPSASSRSCQSIMIALWLTALSVSFSFGTSPHFQVSILDLQSTSSKERIT